LKAYTIICQTDHKTRKKRFIQRYRKGQRHPAHHDHERKDLIDKNNEYDYQDIPGKQIYLNTDQNINELIEQALVFLK